MTRVPDSEFTLLVSGREVVADGVVALALQREDGLPLQRWDPGAHIDLVLGPGLERQYSLCGDPDRSDTWRIAVLREREGRGGSAHVHDELAVGDTVIVRGPRNNFRFDAAAAYVFVAGGIGITPILPMIARAQEEGADWRLWYGGRHQKSMAFRDDLAGYGERVRLWPHDEHGLLPLDEILAAPGPDTLIYCCGPEALINRVEQSSHGWPLGALRVERFAPRSGVESLQRSGFRVVCRRAGLVVEVSSEQSVLEALEAAELPVDYSCQDGVCGTCETVVLRGEVDHRDSVLTAEEQNAGNRMMICVSRARSGELVLDL